MSHPPSRRRHSTKSPSGSTPIHLPNQRRLLPFLDFTTEPTSLCFPSIHPSPSILSLLSLLVDSGRRAPPGCPNQLADESPPSFSPPVSSCYPCLSVWPASCRWQELPWPSRPPAASSAPGGPRRTTKRQPPEVPRAPCHPFLLLPPPAVLLPRISTSPSLSL